MSTLQGGSFKSGFLSAGASELIGPNMRDWGNAEIVKRAVIGGTFSVMGGGKFGNGAMTAAYAYLFNERGLGHSCTTPSRACAAQLENERQAAREAARADAIEPVMVEDLLFAVVGGIEAKAAGWAFGAFKSEAKWAAQMEARGWTNAQISEAVQFGESVSAVNMVNKTNGAMRYIHPQTGQSVVIDTMTREVLHVGGKGFKY